ncbi:MAG: hypothetical protein JNG86_00150, partial [Verrucomicrobiaceae bacterium]|nr:hypothetical protein [Verrucomicrobiaceae bacterium]
MNKPFKFRHATLIAGVFIGLSIVLVTLGVLRTRDLSEIMGHLLSKEHHKVVHVIQKASSAAAVEDDAAQSGYAVTPMIVRGSRVQLLGQTIGIVKDVELSDGEGNVLLPGDVHMNPDYHLKGELRLHGNFAKLVTRDSKVVLSEDMAGFGGVYLEIIPQGGEAVRDGDRPLLVEYSGSARTEMEKLVTTLNHVAGELSGLQEQVKPMLAANSSLRSGLGNIVEYLEKVTKQLPEVLQSAKDSADAIKLLANSAK